MDMERLRRAALALIVGIAGALVWFGSGGSDGSGQINDVSGLAMAAGLLVGLALLAASLVKRTD